MPSSSSRFVLVTALSVALLSAAPARAEPARIEYSAPAACPIEEAFVARVRARGASFDAPAVRGAVVVSIRKDETGFASTLGAEIALLDAARTAIGIGAFEEALRLVERHRREHPRGMLRRDSEVLAIEALFERGDRPQASLRARRFLDAFPDDPHAARVRDIAEPRKAATDSSR